MKKNEFNISEPTSSEDLYSQIENTLAGWGYTVVADEDEVFNFVSESTDIENVGQLQSDDECSFDVEGEIDEEHDYQPVYSVRIIGYYYDSAVDAEDYAYQIHITEE